jgi:hypothetical protein
VVPGRADRVTERWEAFPARATGGAVSGELSSRDGRPYRTPCPTRAR